MDILFAQGGAGAGVDPVTVLLSLGAPGLAYFLWMFLTDRILSRARHDAEIELLREMLRQEQSRADEWRQIAETGVGQVKRHVGVTEEILQRSASVNRLTALEERLRRVEDESEGG